MELNTDQHDKIKFFLPVDIEKGQSANGGEVYKISGQASRQRKDSQGETMSLAGMDVSNLKIINWNHKSKDNPDAYIGEVHKVNFKGDRMMFDGELFADMPMGKGAINLMKALKKRGKQLGISVEGSVVERGSKNPKDPKYNNIVKSRLTALALTPNPVNSDTYANLVEKGFTENLEWEFDEETEVLMKSFEDGTLEDVEKSYTVEDNQHVTKESIEGVDEEEKEKDKQSLSKKVSKADVYDRIFDYFYPIDVKKAQSIYTLIEKLATMEDKEITEEQINKAFEMLEDAQEEKAPEGEVEKSEEQEAVEAKEAKEKEEWDGMVSKAVEVVEGLIEANPEIEKSEVAEKLIEKGYGEKVIDEAYEKATEIEKSEDTPKVDNTEVLKAIETLGLTTDKKFSAIADLFKSQAEQTQKVLETNQELATKNEKLGEDLEKSFETITELNNTIQKFAKQPGQRRSATSFSGKNFDQPIEKSEDAGKTFNLGDAGQRQALVAHLTEESGINKSADNYDKELINIAQGVEIAKSVDTKSMGRLNAMGITIIQ